MADLQGRIAADQWPDTPGRHYAFIENRIPLVFKSASLGRVREPNATRIGPAHWITTATHVEHIPLQEANLKLWAEHNSVDQLLGQLKDVYAFAEPLLRAALKDQYGVEDDVRTTCLHLYPRAQQGQMRTNKGQAPSRWESSGT